ncbi:M67 family metallopeptidase [Sphingomonas hengshuiensis]|uniref:Peptidase n=1 Tax=Sphingomonas hengshuiensis TaxID=1609977 RepID=A0A7U5BFN6_9SPHN|nr:M67 family metallopeptidase [Sphingomonas hengshuiensis]AJP74409.1 peptidase [Sphingomonas hengshuiensis]
MAIRISRYVLNGIKSLSADAAPREACGLLFGEGATIADFSVTQNVAANPHRHFEIDPAALFAALRAERRGGPRIQGYWHSHPSGDAQPSITDGAMAAPDGKLWAIVAAGEVLCWRAGGEGLHGRFMPVAFVEADEPSV